MRSVCAPRTLTGISPLSSVEYLLGLMLFSLGKVVFAVAVMAD
ncbi:hypothetical protein [Nonomuraea cavernae]